MASFGFLAAKKPLPDVFWVSESGLVSAFDIQFFARPQFWTIQA
jgi:hypothetical protein